MASRTFDVPEGHDAVAVQIDFVPGAAGYVSAGDRINLYGVYPIAVTDRVTPRVELLLTNVAVLDVDTTIAPRRGRATTDAAPDPRPSTTARTSLLALTPAPPETVIFPPELATPPPPLPPHQH